MNKEDNVGYERGIQKSYRNPEKNQIEILEMKSSTSQIKKKSSVESLSNILDQVEDKVNEFKKLRKHEQNM
jgi:hypothetical protein